LRLQKNLPEAVGYLRTAVEISPKWGMAHAALGHALLDQKKTDEAIACYRKAIEVRPAEFRGYYGLGNALMALGNLDEAIVCYRKAIELNPRFAEAHTNLGSALSDQKKADEAIACYRKAIELDPKLFQARFNLGNSLSKQGNLDEAIACYRRASELDPNHANARHCLADALAKQGWDLINRREPELRDPVRAFAAAKESVELDPRSPSAWQYMGWIHYRAGNWKASIEALEKSCELQDGGDCCQWIVMSLAHGKLAVEAKLPEAERAMHKVKARNRYEEAVKQIATWGPSGENQLLQATRSFLAEAEELSQFSEKEK
jgi:tetratricopeptide (TPR) repeat protein